MWLFGLILSEFSPNPIIPQKEWVEIYNDSSETADVTNYTIRDSTSSNKQLLSGTIPPNSYFAFSFDKNFLNNTSADIVKLFDKNNNLIDFQSSKAIPLGLAFSQQVDATWCPTDASPNLPNNLCQESYSLQNSPTPIPYISLQITNLDADREIIEITNPNNFTVSLFDWRVRDNSGSIRKLSCQDIKAYSSCNSTFTSGYLNNDTDKLTLLDPLKREISIYDYHNQKQTTVKATSTPKIITPTSIKNKINISKNENKININTSSKSASSVTVNKSSSIHNYLSIILMLIGSIFILFPLIFHGNKRH